MNWLSHQSLAVAIPLLYVIVLLRAGGTYAIGRGIASGSRRTRLERVMARPSYVRATALLSRFGAPVVALSFLTVGFQTVMNLAAGIAQMPLRWYLPALAVGGLAWAVLYATIGAAALALAAKSPWYAAGIVLVIGALVAFVWLRHRRAQATV